MHKGTKPPSQPRTLRSIAEDKSQPANFPQDVPYDPAAGVPSDKAGGTYSDPGEAGKPSGGGDGRPAGPKPV